MCKIIHKIYKYINVYLYSVSPSLCPGNTSLLEQTRVRVGTRCRLGGGYRGRGQHFQAEARKTAGQGGCSQHSTGSAGKQMGCFSSCMCQGPYGLVEALGGCEIYRCLAPVMV